MKKKNAVETSVRTESLTNSQHGSDKEVPEEKTAGGGMGNFFVRLHSRVLECASS